MKNKSLPTSPFTRYIRVTGPKKILKTTLGKLPCDINKTWCQFLKERCKLEIYPNSELVIRTLATGDIGWEAQLGDTVKDFLEKYTFHRAYYTVRLASSKPKRLEQYVVRPRPAVPVSRRSDTTVRQCTPLIITRQRSKSVYNNNTMEFSSIARDTANHTIVPTTSLASASHAPPPLKKRKIVIPPISPKLEEHSQLAGERQALQNASDNASPSPTSKTKRNEFVRKNAISIPLQPMSTCVETSSQVRLSDEDDSMDHDNTITNGRLNDCFRTDNDDASSQITSISMTNHELAKEGIVNTEIKPKVITRLCRNYDNSTMLRIQAELKTLINNNSWHRLTTRAPRTAHLLQDVFQIFASEFPRD